MFKSIVDVAVVVSDANKSADWYREKLGFEIRDKEGHWVTVAPKGSEVVLHLCESKPLEQGNTGIAFSVDDLDSVYKELSGKGVEFTVKPTKEEWGSYAMFKDPDGNEFWIMP
ncbi:MAG TPA: VOC family protein [Candidatus Acidoferrales bacterium]|nr:VOC family protein [Candidatus Acidoferrales bacterium]